MRPAGCPTRTDDPGNAHDAAVAQVLDYHERTKHRFDGYAKGPETLDWEAQPDPFRRYREAPQRPLPLQREPRGPSFASLFEEPLSEALDWNAAGLGRLLQYSLALSAWKEFGGSRWSLRVNPSSGGLHPTECYLCLIGVPDLADGLYHYRADRHCLELRCRYPADAGLQGPLVLLGLSSVAWREAWKYGERAYRYCQLDLGHALAALSYSAALLGRRATPWLETGSLGIARLPGLDRSHEFPADEPETPELLIEAGILGQALYLEAEAVGMHGTGIGCFMDDGLHELLGIRDRRLQVVYQFTVGLPREDTRLASLPPYPGAD